MAVEVKMPQLGLTMEEGTIEKWFKSVGDQVVKGESLAEISTDKLTNEIESEEDGEIIAIIAKEGDTIPVQGLLCVIGAPGEKYAGSSEEVKVEEAPMVVEETPAKVAAEVVQVKNEGRLRISPLAKKVAKERNVDPTYIKGTGPGGRIVHQDVLNHKPQVTIAHEEASASAAPIEEAVQTESLRTGGNRKPITAMRRVIAKRMTESKNTAPHVTLFTEVNMENTIAFRNRYNQDPKAQRLSFTDIIVKMSALALRSVPKMNASLEEKFIVEHSEVHIGVAVALEDGLLVPVVKNADQKGMRVIGKEIKDLAARAKENALASEELSGATFSVSNLGNYDVDGFTPVINLPESSILGVGRIVKKAVVNEEGSIVPASMMTLSLSFDHRLADGALAAQLLKKIKDSLENPESVLL